MKKVAILGSGPAGLMAAHAVGLSGGMIQIFTQGNDDGPTRSRIGGAQFLHKALPVVCDEEPDGYLEYLRTGTIDGYRAKVYGEADVPFVSMERIPRGSVPAWRLQATYDRLWEVYCGGGATNVVALDPKSLIDIIERGKFDLVVSTVPKPALCLAHAGLLGNVSHTFVSQSIRISDTCVGFVENQQIFYNGDKSYSWYRSANIFGHGSTEWGDGAPAKLPYKNLVTVKKPIRTDCVCFGDKVLFTGRYGSWRKGVLSHEAFGDTWKALQ